MLLIYTYCTVKLFGKQWRKPQEQRASQEQGALLSNRVFKLSPPYEAFREYYDEVQDHLEEIAGTDEMISGISILYQYLTINLNIHIYVLIQDC